MMYKNSKQSYMDYDEIDIELICTEEHPLGGKMRHVKYMKTIRSEE